MRSAAAGVAVGGVLMVLVQAPPSSGELRSGPVPPPRAAAPRAGQDGRILVLGLIAPVVAFSLCRQSQTLIERFSPRRCPPGPSRT